MTIHQHLSAYLFHVPEIDSPAGNLDLLNMYYDPILLKSLFLAELLNKILTFLLRKQTFFKKTDLFQENRPFSRKQTFFKKTDLFQENRPLFMKTVELCTLVSCCINFFTNSLDFIILTFYFGDLMPLPLLSFKDITLDFATSTRGRYTENVQKYVLVFRHLGLITSCPRWVLVFYEKIRKQIMMKSNQK